MVCSRGTLTLRLRPPHNKKTPTRNRVGHSCSPIFQRPLIFYPTCGELIDDREDARLTEARLLDIVSDYDEAHGTFTMCLVWNKRDKALAGVH